MSEKPSLLVFADLDGTLLDADTYSPDEAAPGLRRLAGAGARLVPCTTKTRAEIDVVVPQLRALAPQLTIGPVVIENGGALFDPEAGGEPPEMLGAPYDRLREVLAGARRELNLALVGFGDASDATLAERAGLDLDAARRARDRAADEPFWADPNLDFEDARRVEEYVRAAGMRLVHGGRFWHVSGEADKGTAARRVLERLGATGDSFVRAAFGDAASDVPLLEAVEQRFAVRRRNGGVDPRLAEIPGVFVTPGIGPRGFREGVEVLLARSQR